ncbi:hypothetical protein B296_00054449, partial [Ensete ventricosum]
RRLYGQARCCLFPQSSLLAVGGHYLVGATASARNRRCAPGSHRYYGERHFCTRQSLPLLAGDRCLCAAAAHAWTPPKCGLCPQATTAA